MPKSSNKQIEKDEKKILNELRNNANKSINEIAQSLGFSRQKVWRVIKNLEKNHTIWGYTAIVDEEKLNRKSFMMLIKRTNKPIEKATLNKVINRDLEKNIKKIGIEIVNSLFTNGFYDWVVYFDAPDIRTAKGFVESFNKLYEGYVSELHLIEIMFPVKNCRVTNPEINKLKDFFKI